MQPELFDLATMLDVQGPEFLPAGAGELGRKQMLFVTRLLAHGQQARAALEAGYGTNLDSAGVSASRLLRKAKVFRFYRKCTAELAENAQQVIHRVSDRSILMHAKAVECAQTIKDLDARILASKRVETGKNGKRVRVYETERAKQVRLEKHYFTLANRTDTLLASLLGKLNLNVSGSVDFNVHGADQVLVPAETLPALARMRQNVTVPNGN